VTVDGQVVSSTRIRSLIACGDVEQGAHLMRGALEHTAVRGSDGPYTSTLCSRCRPPGGTRR
jgi:hypothetical protein